MAGEAQSPTPGEAYWAALAQGRFQFQRCRHCGNAWLPPREECPKCWSAEWIFEEASGRGKVVSWVRYHVAFHEAFKARLPYNVAVIELAEGPRLVSNLTNLDESGGEVMDRGVELVIEHDHDRALPRFRLL